MAGTEDQDREVLGQCTIATIDTEWKDVIEPSKPSMCDLMVLHYYFPVSYFSTVHIFSECRSLPFFAECVVMFLTLPRV